MISLSKNGSQLPKLPLKSRYFRNTKFFCRQIYLLKREYLTAAFSDLYSISCRCSVCRSSLSNMLFSRCNSTKASSRFRCDRLSDSNACRDSSSCNLKHIFYVRFAFCFKNVTQSSAFVFPSPIRPCFLPRSPIYSIQSNVVRPPVAFANPLSKPVVIPIPLVNPLLCSRPPSSQTSIAQSIIIAVQFTNKKILKIKLHVNVSVSVQLQFQPPCLCCLLSYWHVGVVP